MDKTQQAPKPRAGYIAGPDAAKVELTWGSAFKIATATAVLTIAVVALAAVILSG